jgi:XTP/dITP diphosphohydrolase
MKELFIATTNKGKFIEFADLLKTKIERILSTADFPEISFPPETGKTFEENAVIKAKFASSFTSLPSLADDSGLVVDALGGLPGVTSARFAGDNATDRANNLKLLNEMANLPDEKRAARFICSLAFCFPKSTCVTFNGVLEGKILFKERGSSGFGYDPLFIVEGFDKTLAELEISEKNIISHRAQAFSSFLTYFS